MNDNSKPTLGDAQTRSAEPSTDGKMKTIVKAGATQEQEHHFHDLPAVDIEGDPESGLDDSSYDSNDYGTKDSDGVDDKSMFGTPDGGYNKSIGHEEYNQKQEQVDSYPQSDTTDTPDGYRNSKTISEVKAENHDSWESGDRVGNIGPSHNNDYSRPEKQAPGSNKDADGSNDYFEDIEFEEVQNTTDYNTSQQLDGDQDGRTDNPQPDLTQGSYAADTSKHDDATGKGYDDSGKGSDALTYNKNPHDDRVSLADKGYELTSEANEDAKSVSQEKYNEYKKDRDTDYDGIDDSQEPNEYVESGESNYHGTTAYKSENNQATNDFAGTNDQVEPLNPDALLPDLFSQDAQQELNLDYGRDQDGTEDELQDPIVANHLNSENADDAALDADGAPDTHFPKSLNKNAIEEGFAKNAHTPPAQQEQDMDVTNATGSLQGDAALKDAMLQNAEQKVAAKEVSSASQDLDGADDSIYAGASAQATNLGTTKMSPKQDADGTNQAIAQSVQQGKEDKDGAYDAQPTERPAAAPQPQAAAPSRPFPGAKPVGAGSSNEKTDADGSCDIDPAQGPGYPPSQTNMNVVDYDGLDDSPVFDDDADFAPHPANDGKANTPDSGMSPNEIKQSVEESTLFPSDPTNSNVQDADGQSDQPNSNTMSSNSNNVNTKQINQGASVLDDQDTKINSPESSERAQAADQDGKEDNVESIESPMGTGELERPQYGNSDSNSARHNPDTTQAELEDSDGMYDPSAPTAGSTDAAGQDATARNEQAQPQDATSQNENLHNIDADGATDIPANDTSNTQAKLQNQLEASYANTVQSNGLPQGADRDGYGDKPGQTQQGTQNSQSVNRGNQESAYSNNNVQQQNQDTESQDPDYDGADDAPDDANTEEVNPMTHTEYVESSKLGDVKPEEVAGKNAQRDGDGYNDMYVHNKAKVTTSSADNTVYNEDTVLGDIAEGAQNLAASVASGAKQAWNAVTDATNKAAQSVSAKASELSQDANQAWDNASQEASQAYDGATNEASQQWNAAKNQATQSYRELNNDASQAYDQAANSSANAANEVTREATQAYNSAASASNKVGDEIGLDATQTYNTGKAQGLESYNEATSEAAQTWNNAEANTEQGYSAAASAVEQTASNTSSEIQDTFNNLSNKVSDVYTSGASNAQSTYTEINNPTAPAYNKAEQAALEDFGTQATPTTQGSIPGSTKAQFEELNDYSIEEAATGIEVDTLGAQNSMPSNANMASPNPQASAQTAKANYNASASADYDGASEQARPEGQADYAAHNQPAGTYQNQPGESEYVVSEGEAVPAQPFKSSTDFDGAQDALEAPSQNNLKGQQVGYTADITADDLQALGDKAGNLRMDGGDDQQLIQNRSMNVDFAAEGLDIPGRVAPENNGNDVITDEENTHYGLGSEHNNDLEQTDDVK